TWSCSPSQPRFNARRCATRHGLIPTSSDSGWRSRTRSTRARWWIIRSNLVAPIQRNLQHRGLRHCMVEQAKPRKRSRRRAAQDAHGAVEPAEILAFKFSADRFGYVRSDRKTEIEQAHQLLRALDYWVETIRELFGDEDAGLQAASTARIISYYPTWSST